MPQYVLSPLANVSVSALVSPPLKLCSWACLLCIKVHTSLAYLYFNYCMVCLLELTQYVCVCCGNTCMKMGMRYSHVMHSAHRKLRSVG